MVQHSSSSATALGWLLLYWLAALATHASGLYHPMHCDYSCRLRVAREWADGKELYRETYDNPQPTVFLWALATDSSRPALTNYIAETSLAAATCVVFRRALLKSLPRIANLTPLVLIVWSGVSPTFYGGQIAEAPALWLDVLGLSCFSLALTTGRVWLAVAAGCCFVAMVGFRVPSALHAASWVALCLLAPRSRFTIAGKAIAAAAVGVLLGLLALYVFGRVDGFWDELLVVVRRNFSYGAIDRVPLAASLLEGGKTLARIQLSNTIAGLLLAISGCILIALRARLRRGERMWVVVAMVWLLAALAGAFPGGRHYAHYYHLTWPALSVLGLLWLAPLRRQLRPADRPRVASRLALGIGVGVVVMGSLGMVYEAAKARRDWRQGVHPWNRIEAAAEYLQRETAPSEPLLMNVWLDWAELYWRVPRPAPSLSIPHVVPRDRYDEWLATTARNLPEWIVTDDTLWEPVDGPLRDARSIEARDALAARIEREYAVVRQFEELRILRRRGER